MWLHFLTIIFKNCLILIVFELQKNTYSVSRSSAGLVEMMAVVLTVVLEVILEPWEE